MDSTLQELRIMSVYCTIDYMAKSLRDETGFIFPSSFTAKDVEQTFLYVASLFDYWDYCHGYSLEDATEGALGIFFKILERDYGYSETKIYDVKSNLTETMRNFAIAYDDYIHNSDSEESLAIFVKKILSCFPSAESTSAFSFAGVSFANHFANSMDFIRKIYDILVDADSETLEEYLSGHGITYSSAEQGEPLETSTVSPTDSSEHKTDRTQPQTENEEKKEVIGKKKGIKRFLPFLCLICLICSLIGNINLYYSNSKLIKENTRALSDVEYWKYWYDVEKKHATELSTENYKMRSEYNFYHSSAAIVTEYGYRYHRYDCPHLDNVDSIWIYNIEAAKSRGYTPCKDCWY